LSYQNKERVRESIPGVEPAMTPAVRVIGIDQPDRRAVNAPITIGAFGNGKYI
jgi:hypothetical protein